MKKGHKRWNFVRWVAGRRMEPPSDDDESGVASVEFSKPAKSTSKAKAKAITKSRNRKKQHRTGYRRNYPDPRPSRSSKERFTWSEDWHRGHPYKYKRHIPVLSSYAVGQTPDTEARVIRPLSLPRLDHPRIPRDFWRDGVMMGPAPKRSDDADDDSGYGSLAGSDEDGDDHVKFYDARRDQISPPLRYGKVIVEPNAHFHVNWTKTKTTESGMSYQCRAINGYKDGVIRFWPQGVFEEANRLYLPRHDSYRRKLEKSTLNPKK